MQCSQLLSIKTGGCTEDCKYCSQSARYSTPADAERLKQLNDVVENAKAAKARGADRFCMGAAWREVEDGEEFEQVLDMVGLADTLAKMPADLSGGQKKRVALARAIVLNPRVILYDEPTTGLDPIRADVINELILKLQRELNVTSIVVTHDLQSAFHVADRIAFLYEGRILFEGSADDARASDEPLLRNFLQGGGYG